MTRRRSAPPKSALPRPVRPKAETPAAPAKDAERIAKVMARVGLASRREAETWITGGRVAVNGKVIASPALDVRPSDRITVDGQPLPQRERTRLFLYHKPRGLVTSHGDPQGRPTIFAALPGDLPRLVSVGRLDINTEGLLLLTNDGGLARVLELPETGWLRRYRVRVHGHVLQPALDALRGGVTVEGVRYGPVEATVDRVQGANSWLTFAIREGKNREVRNVLRHLGLSVNRLIRVSYGPFQLGELGDGAVEEVRTRALRDQLGEAITVKAGADFAGPLVMREAPGEPVRSMRPQRSTAARRARDAENAATVQTNAPPKAAKKRSRASLLERFGGPELARRDARQKGRPPAVRQDGKNNKSARPGGPSGKPTRPGRGAGAKAARPPRRPKSR